MMFQSLSGFQARCNTGSGIGCCSRNHLVSIPVGFSSSLQHSWRTDIAISMTEFQSLSGFQARCNRPLGMHLGRIFKCFNPCRVFKLAATIGISYFQDSGSTLFQSLSGFQARCNRHCGLSMMLLDRGFNPCRVFKLAATCQCPQDCGSPDLKEVSIPVGFSSSLQLQSWDGAIASFDKFQSLSGFQARCNGGRLHRRGHGDTGFQSLSGFQARCNIGLP